MLDKHLSINSAGFGIEFVRDVVSFFIQNCSFFPFCWMGVCVCFLGGWGNTWVKAFLKLKENSYMQKNHFDTVTAKKGFRSSFQNSFKKRSEIVSSSFILPLLLLHGHFSRPGFRELTYMHTIVIIIIITLVIIIITIIIITVVIVIFIIFVLIVLATLSDWEDWQTTDIREGTFQHFHLIVYTSVSIVFGVLTSDRDTYIIMFQWDSELQDLFPFQVFHNRLFLCPPALRISVNKINTNIVPLTYWWVSRRISYVNVNC